MISSAQGPVLELDQPVVDRVRGPDEMGAVVSATTAASAGENSYASASSGVGKGPSFPLRSCRIASAERPASHCASSGSGAHSTETATIAGGSASRNEGRNDNRYRSNAASTYLGLKWYTNENGNPSIPASSTLKTDDPRSHTSGR